MVLAIRRIRRLIRSYAKISRKPNGTALSGRASSRLSRRRTACPSRTNHHGTPFGTSQPSDRVEVPLLQPWLRDQNRRRAKDRKRHHHPVSYGAHCNISRGSRSVPVGQERRGYLGQSVHEPHGYVWLLPAQAPCRACYTKGGEALLLSHREVAGGRV
jgi:hypothetical protein